MGLSEIMKKEEINSPLAVLNSLEPEKRNSILAKVNGLNEKDANTILEYGIESSKKLSNYTHTILESTKLKDSPEVNELMTSLMTEIGKVDTDSLTIKKKGLFSRLFKTDDIKNLLAKYESVSEVLKGVTGQLEKAQYELKKDVTACNQFGNNILEYIKDLDEDILILKLKYEELEKKIKEKEVSVDTSDQLAVYQLEEDKAIIQRIDKRCADLMLVRSASILMLPQLKMVRDGNEILIDKIKTSITTAIPMWEMQISLAIQISKKKNAVAIQKAVTDTTNQLIEKNSTLLNQGSVAIAKEMERQVIDVETLKKSTESLIKTISDIKAIQKEGQEKRKKINTELYELQTKLNSTYLALEEK